MLKIRKLRSLPLGVGVGVWLLLISVAHCKVVPTNRRETSVGGGVDTSNLLPHPQPQPQPQIYSTLPDTLQRNPAGVPSSDHTHASSSQQGQGQGQGVNYFNYQVDQLPQSQIPHMDTFTFQPHPQQQHQQPHPQQQQDFAFQQQPQQSQFPVGFPDGNNGGFPPQGFQGQDFQAFDTSANEIQEEESPGFFTSLMTSLLDGTGLGGLFSRAREMWSGLTETFGGGSAMSRVAMGVMALPLMIPMAAVPLGLGAMGLMALPILQLTLPGIRRSLGGGAALLRSEQCMERLSCNLAKRFEYESLFARLERSDNRWLNRVSKSVKAARTGEGCQQFSCSPVTRMQELVRRHLLGEGGNEGVQKEGEAKLDKSVK